MDDFLKMDIFFIVATAAAVVLSVLLVLVLVRVLRVLKNIEEVTDIVVEESEQIRDDIREVRERVKKEGHRFGQLISLIGGFAKPKRRSKKTTTTKE
ncbi:hypothetical protein KJ819_02455 [Patescibacteria group bacterium]|nr:hypothetical protein [Patescibacteria group bacterium]MBU1500856.1 hypothetical protein [Patescibacteria group bacterium]MBU2080911.1 hypothetical protein [Patescibacteria group bacterium]MBU2124016.1 hypothetical protein [Patescibacteria group bacterium]MBU2194693.1 hypothetical protein [Patescibacteria group bacterium]